MIELLSFGTVATGLIILVYGLVTVIRNVNSSRSLRDSEKIHRFMLVIGGLLIGLGIGSQQRDISSISLLEENFVVSLLLSFAGFALILLGGNFLKSQLWIPLENISEYSAEFGSNFIATRLPETGGLELERFAHRFNANAINLSNDISMLEIQVDKIEESLANTVNAGKDLSNAASQFGDIAIQFSDSSVDQLGIIREIGHQVEEFTVWYDDSQVKLRENFVELRSISEMGNLIAINAAVEASNLEERNPGFETLATKLRDLARSLETRQEALRRLVDDVSNFYEGFKEDLKANVERAIQLSDSTTSLNSEIETLLQAMSQREFRFSDEYNELSRSISKFKETIPTGYIK